MTKKGINQLHYLINDMEKYSCLNYANLKFLLLRIIQTDPIPVLSSVNVISRKKLNVPRSKYILDNGRCSFFKDKSVSFTGGEGVIKNGYASQQSSIPCYSIKNLNAFSGKMCHTIAKREVACNRLLGRQSFFYEGKKEFYNIFPRRVVTEWVPGKSLDEYSSLDLKQIEIETAFKCLKPVFFELNSFHKKNRIHGDIKPTNLILDLSIPTMHLVQK